MSFELDISDVLRAGEEYAAGVETFLGDLPNVMRKGMMVGRAAARSEAPYKTGALFNSIGYGVGGGGNKVTGRLVALIDYARWVVEGTQPHDIEAHGNALRFDVGGTVFFRKRVHHPGTHPNDFMGRAMLPIEVTLETEVQASWHRALPRFT
jgi:hypothetical protein